MNPLKILRNIMKKIVLLLMCFLAILNKTQAQYLNAQTYEFSIETIKSVSIANSVTNSANNIFNGNDELTSITIIGEGNMQDFTSTNRPWETIKQQINEITISEQITSIGNYAFEGCSINSITIPNQITSIGSSAFSSCSLLSKVVLT